MKMVIIETKDIHDSEELAEKLLEAKTSDNKSNGSVLTAKDISYTCLLYTSPSPRDRG